MPLGISQDRQFGSGPIVHDPGLREEFSHSGTIRYHMSRNLLWCYAMPRSRSSRLASDTSAAAELVALRAGKGASTRDCKNERRTPGPPRTACLLFESS